MPCHFKDNIENCPLQPLPISLHISLPVSTHLSFIFLSQTLKLWDLIYQNFGKQPKHNGIFWCASSWKNVWNQHGSTSLSKPNLFWTQCKSLLTTASDHRQYCTWPYRSPSNELQMIQSSTNWENNSTLDKWEFHRYSSMFLYPLCFS